MGPYPSFLAVLCIFHTSEFALACMYMRRDLSARSTLISLPYCLAMACASLEYWLEKRWLDTLHLQWVSIIGAVLVVLGETIRKAAMVGCPQSLQDCSSSLNLAEMITMRLLR